MLLWLAERFRTSGVFLARVFSRTFLNSFTRVFTSAFSTRACLNPVPWFKVTFSRKPLFRLLDIYNNLSKNLSNNNLSKFFVQVVLYFYTHLFWETIHENSDIKMPFFTEKRSGQIKLQLLNRRPKIWKRFGWAISYWFVEFIVNRVQRGTSGM